MKKTVLLFALLLALISCDKKSKIEKQVEEIPMEIINNESFTIEVSEKSDPIVLEEEEVFTKNTKKIVA